MGGAIRLYSQRPEGDGTGMVQATYGSRNRADVRTSWDIGITDTLALRIAGVIRSQDGYIDRLDFGCVNPPGTALNPAVGGVQPTLPSTGDCVVADEGEVNYQAIRGQLRWQPTDSVDINIIGDYTHDYRNSTGSVLRYANNANPNVRGEAFNVPYDSRFICGRYCNYVTYRSPAGSWTAIPGGPPLTGFPLAASTNDGRTRFEGWGVSGQIDIDVTDDLQLQSISAYREYTSRSSNDDDLSPLSIGNGFLNTDFWSFSQEVRLNGEFADGAVEYTVGGFYMKQRSVAGTTQDIRYAAIPLQFIGDDPVPAETAAAFAHVSWHVTDRLTLTGGLRYTDESKDYTFFRSSYDGTPNPFLGGLNGLVGSYRNNRVDYRANVQYAFTDDIMAYAQFSTGFKGGGINPRPFVPAQVQPFGPETLQAYEAGIKTDLFDRRMRFNLAGFFNDYRDIQLTLLSCPQFGGPGPCALPSNAGDAHVWGIELETSIRPVDGLIIDGSLSYINFSYQEINPAAGGPTNPAGVQLDDTAPYTPEWSFSFGMQYEIPLGDAGTLTPRIDGSYQSQLFTNAVNSDLNRVDGRFLGNARLTWRNLDEDIDVALEVTNVFDRYYDLTTFDLVPAQFASAQPGRPREWALTVTKRF